MRRLLILAIAVLAVLGMLTGCTRRQTSETPAMDQGPAAQLRLGYLPNITHAAALIGVERGLLAGQLGTTALSAQTFNAGPDEVNALLGGSLDAAFLGPGPAISAFSRSGGEAVRLVAGVASGGVQLVVRPEITALGQLAGCRIATPQLANTQDIALKTWLAGQRLPTGAEPGDVQVINIDNAQAVNAYRTGQLDGGWLPEPYTSRLVAESGAHVLVDEASLWPDGRFPTTVLIVRTQYLQQHPQTVAALLRGLLQAEDYARADPTGAKAAANSALGKAAGKPLAQPVLDRAWSNITITTDPLAARFPRLAADAVTAGVAASAPDLHGFVDLGPLNTVLTAAGRPPVDAAGLDRR
ncbi:MAG: ABC transporter substrate-binding protein [Actinomycetota bacterium]|nr:ABC transporter substrate-binding protein [Actinomycetota bacterium]